eukprot:jgi/Hompol1/7113/HPOL_000656-RA
MNEVKAARDAVKSASKSRYLKLKKQYKRITQDSDVYAKYLAKAKSWIQDVQRMETNRFQRFKHDYSVMLLSIENDWSQLSSGLLRERSVWGPEHEAETRWKLERIKMAAKRKTISQSSVNILEITTAEAPENEKSKETPAEKPVDSQAATTVTVQPEVSVSTELAIKSLDDETADDDDVQIRDRLQAEDLTEDDFTMDTKPQLEMQVSSENVAPEDKDSHHTQIENDWEEVALEEDQNGKILRLLEPGDEIVEIVNCGRLVGLELIEGLFVICHENIYLVDNYYKNSDGEIVDIDEVPAEDRNIYHQIITSSKKLSIE